MALLGATLLASLAWGASQPSESPRVDDSRFSVKDAKVAVQPESRAFEIRGGSVKPDFGGDGQYSIVARRPLTKAGGNTCDPTGDLLFRDGFE